MPSLARSPEIFGRLIAGLAVLCAMACGSRRGNIDALSAEDDPRAADAGADAPLAPRPTDPARPQPDGLPPLPDATPPLEDATRPLSVEDAAPDAPYADAPAADATTTPHPESEYCGDAIRDPVTEECDDGTATGSCTADCRVRAVRLVEAGRDTDIHPRGPRRRFGTGRHVISAGRDGFAVVYTENDASPQAMLQPFDRWGSRSGPPVEVSAGSWRPTGDSSPGVAALPGGRYAMTWAGHNPSRVVLHGVSAGGEVGEGQTVSAATAGPKTQPDLVWTGSELVMAWADGSTLPRHEVKLRRFDAEFEPVGGEVALGGGQLAGEAATEVYPALTAFAGGWAAAWRTGIVGLEVIRARAGEVSWETEGHLAAIPGDRPALVELDDERLLLVFTGRTDPGDAGAPEAQHVRAALFDVQAPGAVTSWRLPRLTEPDDTELSLAQSRVDAVRVGERIFVAWESESMTGDARKEQVWLQELSWSAAAPEVIDIVSEWRLPVVGEGAPEQRRPALGVSPLFPEGALIAAWEDHSGSDEERPVPDLMLAFQPVPFVVLGDAGAAWTGG